MCAPAGLYHVVFGTHYTAQTAANGGECAYGPGGVWQGTMAGSLSLNFVASAPPLTITQPPVDTTVCLNGHGSFGVAASGNGPFTYRWQIESAPAGSNVWSDLADGLINGSAAIAFGSATDTLRISHAQPAAAVRYRGRVANPCGAVNSNPAMLIVNTGCTACPADVNGTHGVDIDDLLAVINGWGQCASTRCPADVTGDHVVNIDDLLAVINGWGPCP